MFSKKKVFNNGGQTWTGFLVDYIYIKERGFGTTQGGQFMDA